MPTTVPNQRMVHINRERATSNFLGIQNENWQAAARDLGAHALLLYLYFASNADGYTLALSPAAIRQTIGMPPQTYRDQFLKLLDRGYLVHRSGNQYAFYERPQRVSYAEQENTTDGLNFEDDTPNGVIEAAAVQNAPSDDREINNINMTNNNINRQQEKQVSPVPLKSKFVF